MTKKIKYIIGIDEVGRGPLAGPVTVAAVILRKSDLPKLTTNIRRSDFPILKDSKKLSPKQREVWFKYIKESQKSKVKSQKLYYAVASVSPKVIDRINISKAANLAATNAFRRLIKNAELRIKNCAIYLDGGLYLKELKAKSYKSRREVGTPTKASELKAKTIIKGDEKIPAIALASIVAKVTRDRMMRKLHKKYPKYGFDKHKGYGTKWHFKAIKKYGLSPIHRKSFRLK